MDKAAAIRVKFTFGTKCKLAKLDRATNTNFSSMASLRKLIYKHFPEIEETVERPPQTSLTAPTQLLIVQCKDTAGDYITLEDDDDLDAMELSQSSNIEFCLNLVLTSLSAAHTPSKYAITEGIVSNRTSYKAPAGDQHMKLKPCRLFQSGFCKFGDSCRFSHDLTERPDHDRDRSNLATESLYFAGADLAAARKLKQCRNILEFGSCRYGESCLYSHDLAGRRNNDRDSSHSPTENLPSTSWSSTKAGGSSPSHDRPNVRVESLQSSKVGFHQRSGNWFASRQEGPDYKYWLNRQAGLDSAENIEHLSGEKGLQMLSKVVKQRDLPHEIITLLVKLLAREEIRASLLRQKTNQIYGVLIGSPFLLRLNDHIASHLGMIPSLKPQDVRPYLVLTEELQSRTTDGWKEVPLNALKTVVSKLEESPAKDELIAIVSRLADQCERLRRLLAVAPTEDKHFEGEKFRQMSIVPDKEELLEFKAKKNLPVNRIGIQYSRVSDYLETHFQLLREDCIDPLRQGIKAYRSNLSNTNGKAKHSESSAMLDLRIYLGVQFAGVRCGDHGVEFVLSFHLPAKEKTTEQWESSKKLMHGALLCISSDQFQTFCWGVVSRRDAKELAKGLVAIRLIGESDNYVTAGLQNGQTSAEEFVMVESTASYFEAYCHVLKTLQRQEMEHIPFTPYLLHLEPKVGPPSYLLRRKSGDAYDFSCAFPDIRKTLGKSSFRITQSHWPSGWADSLDRAQRDALKQGLTKELAIIQGPPGTGKTFLGLILVKILLANLKQSPDHNINGAHDAEPDQEKSCDLSGPILIICYTNHALDQFLEGIYNNGETNLIRIGGRGKSEILKNNTLQSLLLKQRMEQGVVKFHSSLFGRGRFQKDGLESKIHRCIDTMGVKFITETMLEGIATGEQRESLFWGQARNRSSSQIVRLWLNEADPYVAEHFLSVKKEDDESDTDFSLPAEKKSRGLMKLLPKSEAHQEGEWIQVGRPGRRGAQRGAGHRDADVPIEPIEDPHEDRWRRDIADEGHPGEGADDIPPQNVADIADEGFVAEEIRLAPDVWQLNLSQRKKLHKYWLEEIGKLKGLELRTLTEEYEEACRDVKEVENEIQLSNLRRAKVVGMTTTAAAKYHDVLKSLKPEIVIVEEAAEVLEGHILSCISPSVQHLILIGDHLQLRPQVAVYDLAMKHKLDVSMFERLVRSGVEHVTLQEQRRMRPNISKLVRSLYPESRDHESVAQYENLSGVKSNVYFFDHKAEEDDGHDAGSKVNYTEAQLVVELCLYLLKQGCYKAENIAILSMYTGQLREIKRLLRPRIHSMFTVKAVGELSQDPGAEEANLLPRVSSVDDYQGEESDIIILSLVRSNAIVTNKGVGKIGFLNISNRICVALTRAKKGMFIFGNADLLAQKSTLWNEVITSMRNDGELGPQLELYCQNHPDVITRISTADDFKQVEDGGCSLPCEYQLECGHACPRRCHPGSHDLIVCPKPCLKQFDECRHRCNSRCHGSEECPPCKVIVTKQLLHCKHAQGVECSKDLKDEVCRSVCAKSLQCGHRCGMLCGRPCTEFCGEKVVKMLPCGHSARMSCFEDPMTYPCHKPCKGLLSDCQHRCQGSCGKCKQGTAHVPCQQKCKRSLPCGHECEAGCSLSCPPCLKKCRKRCFHSRCSEPCGNLCKPCREPCSWQCEHHKCEKSCHEICTRPRCDLPCPKLIRKCGHPCIGLCGEPCPTKCRVCYPETLDIITQMRLDEYEESDRFVQLEDCHHIFEVSGLDTWMDLSETAQQGDGSVAIKLKECPECKTLVWRTHRYSNAVKTKHNQVEDVKRKILGLEQTRQGNLLLEKGDDIGALSAFRQALQRNPGLMEAHYGTGCAFFAGGDYAKAITYLSFVVERSSFASSLGRHITGAHGRGHAVGFVEKFHGRSSARTSDSIAVQAIVQWASALTKSKDFTGAIELCDAVLRRDPENQLAKNLKAKAKNNEVELVVQAMAADVGARGHWYTCPNGHYYTIGECGGATQLSKCPDCKAEVGGGSHRLTAGNRHSNIDGSESSAWPGNH